MQDELMGIHSEPSSAQHPRQKSRGTEMTKVGGADERASGQVLTPKEFKMLEQHIAGEEDNVNFMLQVKAAEPALGGPAGPEKDCSETQKPGTFRALGERRRSISVRKASQRQPRETLESRDSDCSHPKNSPRANEVPFDPRFLCNIALFIIFIYYDFIDNFSIIDMIYFHF